MFQTILADSGIVVFWLIAGGLAYLAISSFMAMNHFGHLQQNPNQGLILLIVTLALGLISLVLVILGLILEGPRREFLYFIGAMDKEPVLAEHPQHDRVYHHYCLNKTVPAGQPEGVGTDTAVSGRTQGYQILAPSRCRLPATLPTPLVHTP